MGRRKIAIKPIASERSRQITFVKRKHGLMKKAFELSVLCGCKVALVVISRNKKLYEYSSVEMNKILHEVRQFTGHRDTRTNMDFECEQPSVSTDDDEEGEEEEEDEDDYEDDEYSNSNSNNNNNSRNEEEESEKAAPVQRQSKGKQGQSGRPKKTQAATTTTTMTTKKKNSPARQKSCSLPPTTTITTTTKRPSMMPPHGPAGDSLQQRPFSRLDGKKPNLRVTIPTDAVDAIPPPPPPPPPPPGPFQNRAAGLPRELVSPNGTAANDDASSSSCGTPGTEVVPIWTAGGSVDAIMNSAGIASMSSTRYSPFVASSMLDPKIPLPTIPVSPVLPLVVTGGPNGALGWMKSSPPLMMRGSAVISPSPFFFGSLPYQDVYYESSISAHFNENKRKLDSATEGLVDLKKLKVEV